MSRPSSVAVIGSSSSAELSSAQRAIDARVNEPVSATVTVYGPKRGARRGGGAGVTAPTHTYWPTDRVLVLAPLGDRAPAALTSLAAAAPAPSGLAEPVARARTDAALWAAGRVPPSVEARLRAAGPGVAPVRGFFASLDAGGAGRIDLLVGLRLASADDAGATADALGQQREALTAALPDARLRAIASRIEIARSGADVAGRVSLTPDELAHIVGLVAP